MFTRSEHSRSQEFFPPESFFNRLRIPAILGIISVDRKIEASARSIHLPETSQQERSGGYNFYGDLHVYAKDIAEVGIQRARTLLYERLFAHLLTMDQEARRRALTYPIPVHFEQQEHTDNPTGRVAGYAKEWRTFLLDALANKPSGIEKDRFSDEIKLTISAFDELLVPIHELLTATTENLTEEQKITLLTEQCGYVKSTLQVTPFLVSLFPDLEEKLGTQLTCYQSTSRMYAYTPSPFHLEGKSSFLYLHQLVYLPGKGFLGLQQGLMSGYLLEDLRHIIATLTEKSTVDLEDIDLMKTVFSPSGSYSHLRADELFTLIKDIVPFKPLAIESGVNPQSCSQDEYENYINALEAIFEHEIRQCARDPEYLIGLQDRIERFSIYLAVAMGMTEKLPVSKMLAKYKKIYTDKQVARNPLENAERIDTGFAAVYHTLKAVPFRLESVLECSAVGTLKVGVNNLGAGTSAQMFSPDMLMGEIQRRRVTDFANAGEAREFAIQYGINPEWIGTVIKHYPEGKHCKACDKNMHWVGQCGEHTMCLQCNAQYNLDHGLVPGMGGRTLEEMQDLIDSGKVDQGRSSNNNTIGIGKFVAGLGNPKLYAQVFLIETILGDKDLILADDSRSSLLVA